MYVCTHVYVCMQQHYLSAFLYLLVTAPIIFAKEEIDYNDVGQLTLVSEDEDI